MTTTKSARGRVAYSARVFIHFDNVVFSMNIVLSTFTSFLYLFITGTSQVRSEPDVGAIKPKL